MPRQQELLEALAKAVDELMTERPSIGIQFAMEWAVSGRLGILLGRMDTVTRWERECDVCVDVEYSQAGKLGDRKRGPPTESGRRVPGMRPDLLIHHRGDNSRNWLACEVKLHDRDPTAVPDSDLRKLRSYKRDFRYNLAVWLSMPRWMDQSGTGAFAAIVNDPEEIPTVQPLAMLLASDRTLDSALESCEKLEAKIISAQIAEARKLGRERKPKPER